MGTAVKPVLLYLMAQAPVAVAVVNPLAVVSLGWPDDVAADVLVFGRTDPYGNPEAAQGIQGYQELGAAHLEEQFDLPFFIACGRGGDDQIGAMSAAVDIYDALIAFIRTDLTFGGALNRWAQVSSFRSYATPTADDAKQGRQWVISAVLTCKNKY